MLGVLVAVVVAVAVEVWLLSDLRRESEDVDDDVVDEAEEDCC